MKDQNEMPNEWQQHQISIAIDAFEDALLEQMDKLGDANVPPYEVVYAAVRMFTHMCFDMAPSEDVARKTIEASVEAGYKAFLTGEIDGGCPYCQEEA